MFPEDLSIEQLKQELSELNENTRSYVASYEFSPLNALSILAEDDSPLVQGESVNILLNFTQFFETRIEYRFQIFTAHSCDFLLPSYARLA